MTNPVAPIVNEIHIENPEAASFKALAIRKIDELKALKEKRKDLRERLNDTLRSDADYSELEKVEKDAKKRRDAKKALLMAEDSELAGIEADIKTLNREIKDGTDDVSDYLVLYAEKSGQLSFLHPDGDEIKIERKAKYKQTVVKKNEKNDKDDEGGEA